MNPFFTSLAQIYNVKRTNFYSWQKNLKSNISCLPTHSKNPGFSRVFTPEQFHVVEHLIDSLSESHYIPIINLLIKKLLRCYYHNLIYKPHPNLQFNCSTHYITKIKKVLSYSTRVFHPKRRSNASDDSISQFKRRCKYVFCNSEKRQIVNSDESFLDMEKLLTKLGIKLVPKMYIIIPIQTKKKDSLSLQQYV